MGGYFTGLRHGVEGATPKSDWYELNSKHNSKKFHKPLVWHNVEKRLNFNLNWITVDYIETTISSSASLHWCLTHLNILLLLPLHTFQISFCLIPSICYDCIVSWWQNIASASMTASFHPKSHPSPWQTAAQSLLAIYGLQSNWKFMRNCRLRFSWNLRSASLSRHKQIIGEKWHEMLHKSTEKVATIKIRERSRWIIHKERVQTHFWCAAVYSCSINRRCIIETQAVRWQ